MSVQAKGSPVIDLSRVQLILEEVNRLVEDLHGQELDERAAVEAQSAGEARRQRARASQSLNLLSDRLGLAAQMVRVEYWSARGHGDPTDGVRPTDGVGPHVDEVH